jgi:hypothetical protein
MVGCSFPRLIPAHLGGRSLLRKALLCPPKRRKQPERYVRHTFEIFSKKSTLNYKK